MPNGWWPLSDAVITLTDDERQIAVGFQCYQAGGAQGVWTFGSINFGSGGGTIQLSASGTRDSYAQEIADIIRDVLDGTTSDFGDGTFDNGAFFGTEDFGATGDFGQVSWTPTLVQIRRSNQLDGETGDGDVTNAEAWMTVAMHRKVWRIHGFDPELQHSSLSQNEKEIDFNELSPDETYMHNVTSTAQNKPGAPGYVSGRFRTMAVDAVDNLDIAAYDNSGEFRSYRPMFQSSPIVLTGATDQLIRVAAHFPYLEGDPTVASGDYDCGRYFMIRGKRAVGSTEDGSILNADGNVVEGVEAEDETQVIEVYWDRQGTTYGSVEDDGDGPQFRIHKWLDPRRFGIDRDKI